jgi:hypothetical protein
MSWKRLAIRASDGVANRTYNEKLNRPLRLQSHNVDGGVISKAFKADCGGTGPCLYHQPNIYGTFVMNVCVLVQVDFEQHACESRARKES